MFLPILSLIAGSVVAPPASAQPGVAMASAAMAADAGTFARRISLSLRNATLKDALKAIAAEANVRIQYRDVQVVDVRRRISLMVRDTPLSHVFEEVLAHTALQAVSPLPNVVTIQENLVDAAAVQGIIIGRVIHARTKAPVPGVTVTIEGTAFQATTDAEGWLRFVNVPEGNRRVVVRAVGFTREIQTVTVTSGTTLNLSFVLTPGASVLDEVIVTGTVTATQRREIANPITVITADDIEKRNINRLEELFRGDVPGVFAMDEGTASYSSSELGGMAKVSLFSRASASLSSFDQNPLKIYIDGVELVDAAYLGTIDPSSIERIEIITGPQAATVYGSGALGGVMQIFTKKGSVGRAAQYTLSLKYGVLENSLNSGRTPSHTDVFSVGGGSPEFTYAGSLSYRYTGQWEPARFNRAIGLQIGASSQRGATGQMKIDASVSTTFGANGTGEGYDVSGLYSQRARTGEWRWNVLAPSRKRSTSVNQTASLALHYRATPAWQHSITLGRSSNKFDLVPSAPRYVEIGDTLYGQQSSIQERNTMSYNTTYHLTSFGFLSSHITLGATGATGSGSSWAGCTGAPGNNTILNCYRSGSRTDYDFNEVTRSPRSNSYGYFGSWRAGLFNKIFMTFGLRAEYNDTYGWRHKRDWSPTNGITYTFDLHDMTVKLQGSYGAATKPPPDGSNLEVLRNLAGYVPEQYLFQAANPDIRPERSRGPQLGMELYYGNRASFTVNHFNQRVDDLLARLRWDSAALHWGGIVDTTWYTTWKNVNAGTVRQLGWELTGTANLGPLALRGSYTWNETRILKVNGNTSVTYTRDALVGYSPTHFASWAGTYAYGGTSISLSFNWVGRALTNTSTRSSALHTSNAMTYARLQMYKLRSPRSLTQDAPSYLKSNLAVNRQLNRWITATANVTNLGNTFASQANWSTPTLGRQTLLGLSVKFPR